jgi:cytochrome b561
VNENEDPWMTLGLVVLAASLLVVLLSAFPTISRGIGGSAAMVREIGFLSLALAVFVIWWRASGPKPPFR